MEGPPLVLLVFSDGRGDREPKVGACPVDNGHLYANPRFPGGELKAGF